MDLTPKKPKPMSYDTAKPLAEAIAKTKETPADTKALELAQKDVDKSAQELKKAMEKSHKSFSKAFTTLPDVTKGSPKPGPIPIPYPVFSKLEKETKDAVKGTDKALKKHEVAYAKLVKVIDKELKTLSKFNQSSGDKDAMAAQKGLISAKAKGKDAFVTYSMDVKLEGQSVPRFFDIAKANSKKGK